MEYKSFPAVTKAIDGREVTGISSVFGNIDSYQDIVHLGAFKKTLKERRDRFRHLWQHEFRQPPTAVIKEIKEVKKGDLPPKLQEIEQVTGGLEVTREYLDTPRGDEILKGLVAGAINEMSFAYDAVKYDFEELELDDSRTLMVRNLREVRLWETSDVNWGANDLTVGSKSSIIFKESGYLPESAEKYIPVLSDFVNSNWEQLSAAEKERIASHYAWRSSEDSFEALMFPHHEPSKTGLGKANWALIQHFMSKLNEVPSSERTSVHNHLSQHYSFWGKTPPSLEWFAVLEAINSALKVPSILGSKDLLLLTDVRSRISDRLAEAESVQPLISPKDRRILQRQLQLAQLEMELR